ncbi:MAG: ThuA domain-containing protein [Pirellulaceae bacterium]|nr:ThuA domain-containing protein [Pirellulaceae bacterium]
MKLKRSLIGAVLAVVAVGVPLQAQPTKRVVFLAGRPSHGYGSHEHLAGCRLLADAIQRSTKGQVVCDVYGNGWPEDDSVLDGADAIVMYCDGGGGHPALRHLPRLGELMKRGVGFTCLHYAVEVPKEHGGSEFLEWLGGYFETHWSVNPHWVAEYTQLPEHPVTRGVNPFKANDEWYFHMRFRPELAGVTPILSAVAPDHTMLRPDGPHSGNPEVRKEVAQKVPQHTAWVFERPDGGRSFGFTGGHFHWNWGREEILRLVCNAILWTTQAEVPKDGLPVLRPSVETLEQGQDEQIPKDHEREKLLKEFQLLSRPKDSDQSRVSDQKRPGTNQQAATDGSSIDSLHDPNQAVGRLRVASGLQVTLAASEPMLQSLTNLDVDHRGRVWVCEVVNYRGHLGKRPAGDRILILEDEDADGVMDTCKVFYQGTDIDSAMGICVLGNRVIVSASPNVWSFVDEDGDDVPDRKDLLFSKTGQPQHDHSAHSFIFGPDGKLYWNFGNTGQAVHDAQGQPVVDMAGNQVIDNGQPYYGGMVFRCNLDGSEFETLAHNFRNNYEIAIDSFGTLWQTDNDDDGNKAARVNYVMEYGNYGYRDELTGAGWQAMRVNMEGTIPEQHWHLNDPGVVPTMLITGSGSPSAATIYEGDLLPATFRNQLIHCEPGHHVVRAYPTTILGAGYAASIENLLKATSDQWFRPVDVCAAPDGSLLVTDWYDPGVGGHQMGDLDRGRLFRIAPPDSKYHIPKLDVSTPVRAVSALASPNASVRYLAWQAIEHFGKSAQAALEQMATDQNPRFRARAYWALGKLPGHGKAVVASALSDPDADVRCMAIRLARQLRLAPSEYSFKVVSDASAAVRRELAIALRLDTSPEMPQTWATLACSYAGQDRWYLEALGIGAHLRWDECFDAYVARSASMGAEAHADIVWRSRSDRTASHLIATLCGQDLAVAQSAQLLRGLEFQSAATRQHVVDGALEYLSTLTVASETQQSLIIQLLMRAPDGQQRSTMKGLQEHVVSYFPKASRQQQFEILEKLSIPDAEQKWIELIRGATLDAIAARAAERFFDSVSFEKWSEQFTTTDQTYAIKMAEALAASNPRSARPVLLEILRTDAIAAPIKVIAAKGLTRTPRGAEQLLEMAEANTLIAEARLIVGSLLREHASEAIRQRATELFPPLKSKAAEPLPPLAALVQKSGDAERGAEVYRGVATCAKCHPLQGDGKQIGPDLSEIGDKLAKEALYVAILDPSAGLSHNFETYAAVTADGQLITGLLVSQTQQHIVLRDAEGLDHNLNQSDLESFAKQSVSLMPSNLVEALTVGQLVDLVEYLQSLKKFGADNSQ